MEKSEFQEKGTKKSVDSILFVNRKRFFSYCILMYANSKKQSKEQGNLYMVLSEMKKNRKQAAYIVHDPF